MKIPHVKTVVSKVEWGEIELAVRDGSVYVRYHNPIYLGSPFDCPQGFSTEYTADEILNSAEVTQFLSRFN